MTALKITLEIVVVLLSCLLTLLILMHKGKGGGLSDMFGGGLTQNAGTSGVAGGSLLLIPMACSLFGISTDVAMQVVGVGFIVGVIQDSMETMINSSSDVLFTAVAEYRQKRLRGEDFHF